jgi:hypothetical protein
MTVPVARGVVQSLESARKRRGKVIGGKLPHYSTWGMVFYQDSLNPQTLSKHNHYCVYWLLILAVESALVICLSRCYLVLREHK